MRLLCCAKYFLLKTAARVLHCCISAGREKHPLPGENPGYFYAATHLHEGGRGTDPSQLCRRESHILYSCLCLRVAGVGFIVTTGRGYT